MKKIVLFIYSDYTYYPPTVHAANILQEKGYNVSILSIKYEKPDIIALNKGVKVKYVGNHHTGVLNILQYSYSCLFLWYYCLIHKIDWIISYDGMSVAPSFFASKFSKAKWIYHQHDYWDKATSWLKLPQTLEIKLAKYADCVSFPQDERAQLFMERAKLKEFPLIVYNCPRLSWGKEASMEKSPINNLIRSFDSIIIYQGGLSFRFSLEKVILSMKYVKEGTCLLIFGRVLEDGIDEYLQNIVNDNMLHNKVFIRGRVEYDDLPLYTKFSKIGIAKFTNNKNEAINNLCLAGASNKLAEYFAFGLPILAPTTESNKKFIKENNCGLCCNGTDINDIADKINYLLENENVRLEIGNNNRKLFEEKYSFDAQFEKILNKIN